VFLIEDRLSPVFTSASSNSMNAKPLCFSVDKKSQTWCAIFLSYVQVVKLFLKFVQVCFWFIVMGVYLCISYPSHNLTGSEYPWYHRREWMPRAALSHPPPPRDLLRKAKHIPIILIFHVKTHWPCNSSWYFIF